MTQDSSTTHSTEDVKLPKKQENFWVETLKTLGLSLVLALGTRQFVADARFIPTGSMEPTLLVDDRVMVDKVSYRFSSPQRGDIVVFEPTDALKAQGHTESFIKRIIGLPGDKVVVVDDQVTINGQPLPENYPSTVHVTEMTQLYDKMRRKKPDIRLWSPDDKGPGFNQVVPPDHYVVLGDHRGDSSDSRVWGFLPKKNLIGKAVVRYWPLDRMGALNPKPSYVK
jgi:signal peptidase I